MMVSPYVLSCRSGASDSGDPCIQSQESAEEGHKEQGPVASDKESKNAPTGRQPAKWRLDVVIPPPLPAKASLFSRNLSQYVTSYLHYISLDPLLRPLFCQSSYIHFDQSIWAKSGLPQNATGNVQALFIPHRCIGLDA